MHNQQATIAGRAQPTDERRGAHRQRIFKGGVLRFNRGYGALECVVRDVSERGALLVFGDTAAVPSQFDLRVGPAGEWRAASVRWRRDQRERLKVLAARRRDTRVGVSFE
mgnify:CR=1 FL=1